MHKGPRYLRAFVLGSRGSWNLYSFLMPYEIQRRGSQYCVVRDDGETMGCHGTHGEALGQQRALYASEQKESTEELVKRFMEGSW